MVVSELHPEKACSSMDLTPDDIATELKDLHP
jgi:hypothetical protein